MSFNQKSGDGVMSGVLDQTIMYGSLSYIIRAALAFFIIYALAKSLEFFLKWRELRIKNVEASNGNNATFPIKKISLWLLYVAIAFAIWSQTFHLPRPGFY
jgi:hypothetical protein